MNAKLASRNEDWKFRCFPREFYNEKHFKRDNIESLKALSGIGYALKSKLLYKSDCIELQKEDYAKNAKVPAFEKTQIMSRSRAHRYRN